MTRDEYIKLAAGFVARHYRRGGKGGQMFTEHTCFLCDGTFTSSSTAGANLCDDCYLWTKELASGR